VVTAAGGGGSRRRTPSLSAWAARAVSRLRRQRRGRSGRAGGCVEMVVSDEHSTVVKGNAIVPMPPAGDGGGASDGGRRPRDGARAVRAPFAQAHKHENTQTLKHSTSGDPPGGF
jgi:hypothetical protein